MSIMSHEVYTLTLTHTLVGKDGERYLMEEPIEVRQIACVPNSGIVINEMIDRMRDYLLSKVNER